MPQDYSLQQETRFLPKRYSNAMPFSASSFLVFSFLAKCVSPMPRSTLGALVN
jgi:hypothetical protein